MPQGCFKVGGLSCPCDAPVGPACAPRRLVTPKCLDEGGSPGWASQPRVLVRGSAALWLSVECIAQRTVAGLGACGIGARGVKPNARQLRPEDRFWGGGSLERPRPRGPAWGWLGVALRNTSRPSRLFPWPHRLGGHSGQSANTEGAGESMTPRPGVQGRRPLLGGRRASRRSDPDRREGAASAIARGGKATDLGGVRPQARRRANAAIRRGGEAMGPGTARAAPAAAADTARDGHGRFAVLQQPTDRRELRVKLADGRKSRVPARGGRSGDGSERQ